jgi:hypothetical protein
MAAWGPEIEWHERDVVVPAFRRWLEAQGWTTEAEKGYIDVVAHRGNETIYAEVKARKLDQLRQQPRELTLAHGSVAADRAAQAKGRTKGRPGAGLDSLYGQLLRRMPAKEIGDSSTRFAVVVPKASEAAALRVPSRARDLLRIDVYVVSDEGDVEIQIGDTLEPEVEAATPKPKKTKEAPKWKALPNAEKAQYLLEHPTLSDRTWTNEPRLKGEKRDAFIRRVLLGQVLHGQAVESDETGTVEETEPAELRSAERP